MTSALIGASGFVGGTLLRQTAFDDRYRSTNIQDMRGRAYDLIICAGAPAQKWLANREPEADRRNLLKLMEHLGEVSAKRFILISTVDVFGAPIGVTEDSEVAEHGLHPYGAHRRQLERFVEERFANHLIVRLPGLVGPGLRKNVIYDFLRDNNLGAIDSRASFQFYPMVNLWYDLQVATSAGLSLVHLTAEPITVREVADQGFGRRFEQTLDAPPAAYDFRTRHAKLFGGAGAYQYSRRETVQAVRAFAQGELLALAREPAA